MTERVWTYEVHELSEGFSAIVYDQNGQCIADHLTEERARLIAAAPELLEALQVAASVMRTFANMTPTDGWAASEINAALRLADPALAKAGA